MTEITKSEKKPRDLKEKMYTFVDPAVKVQIVAFVKQTDCNPSQILRLLVMRRLENYTAINGVQNG